MRKKGVVRPGSRETEHPKVEAPSEPTAVDSGKLVIRRYEDLFPKDDASSAEDRARERETVIGTSRAFDPEGAAFSSETKLRNSPRLERFVDDLAERVTVPLAVRKIMHAGEARLRIRRDRGEWSVTNVTGDPLVRAIIYDSISEMLASHYGQQLLSEVEYDTVRVVLRFSVVSLLHDSMKPIFAITEANTVFLNLSYKEVDERWLLAMPIDHAQGNDAVLPNIIGIGQFVVHSLRENNPSTDISIKRLKASPAYVRPLRK